MQPGEKRQHDRGFSLEVRESEYSRRVPTSRERDKEREGGIVRSINFCYLYELVNRRISLSHLSHPASRSPDRITLLVAGTLGSSESRKNGKAAARGGAGARVRDYTDELHVNALACARSILDRPISRNNEQRRESEPMLSRALSSKSGNRLSRALMHLHKREKQREALARSPSFSDAPQRSTFAARSRGREADRSPLAALDSTRR